MKNTSDLVMVTGNKGKVVEVSRGLGKPVTQVELDLDEVQSLELSYIVKRKAEDAYKIIQKPLLTDDAGLFIYEWQGFPGPFVKYIESCGGPELMLDMTKSLKDRHAYFVCAMAYHDGKTVHVAEGRLEGRLSIEIQPGGWGFDPIFIPEGYNQTMGYLRDNKVPFISHCNRALDQLKKLFG
jgi:XTP/dITP diphosphohydrolase